MGRRKRYTAEEKVKILREVLEEGKQISQVAEKYGLSPNNIFKWRVSVQGPAIAITTRENVVLVKYKN